MGSLFVLSIHVNPFLPLLPLHSIPQPHAATDSQVNITQTHTHTLPGALVSDSFEILQVFLSFDIVIVIFDGVMAIFSCPFAMLLSGTPPTSFPGFYWNFACFLTKLWMFSFGMWFLIRSFFWQSKNSFNIKLPFAELVPTTHPTSLSRVLLKFFFLLLFRYDV